MDECAIKQDQFRKEIRRRHIQENMKLMRHSLLDSIGPAEAVIVL